MDLQVNLSKVVMLFEKVLASKHLNFYKSVLTILSKLVEIWAMVLDTEVLNYAAENFDRFNALLSSYHSECDCFRSERLMKDCAESLSKDTFKI
jgi:hypothetical protein